VRRVDALTGMGDDETRMLLRMCGKVRLNNMAGPKDTIGASIDRNTSADERTT
jgi:hypothetical protein